MSDMYTKQQNLDISEQCVPKTDISIHEPWDTSDMAHRSGGLTVDDDIQEYKKPWVGLTEDEITKIANKTSTFKQCVQAIEAKLKERNT